MKSGHVRRAAVNLPDEKLEREMGIVSDTVPSACVQGYLRLLPNAFSDFSGLGHQGSSF